MTMPQPWPRPTQPWRTPGTDTVARRTPAVTVAPVSSAMLKGGLRSLDNWRALLHQITPVIVTALVTFGIVTDTQAALWVPLLFAVLDPILSVANTQDKIRKIIYGLAGLLQVGGIGAGLAGGIATGSNGLIAAGVGAGVTVLSTFLARFFTPTTTLVPTG